MRMCKAFWDPFNIVLILLSPREPHTQLASWMQTKVVVATTWLPVGIGLAHTTPELWSHFLYLLTHFMDLQTNVHTPMTHFLDLLDISWTLDLSLQCFCSLMSTYPNTSNSGRGLYSRSKLLGGLKMALIMQKLKK